MKYYSLIVLFLLFCGIVKGQQSIITDDLGNKWQSFGEKITPKNTIQATKLPEYMEGKKKAKVKIAGKIIVCCQKKGCWMDVDLGNGQTMTVRFKDYSFFVPKDAASKQTIIKGKVERKTLSVEWLKHKAEDAGKSQEYIDAINQPKEALEFTATGVLIAMVN